MAIDCETPISKSNIYVSVESYTKKDLSYGFVSKNIATIDIIKPQKA
jgi:hypothetical protein